MYPNLNWPCPGPVECSAVAHGLMFAWLGGAGLTFSLHPPVTTDTASTVQYSSTVGPGCRELCSRSTGGQSSEESGLDGCIPVWWAAGRNTKWPPQHRPRASLLSRQAQTPGLHSAHCGFLPLQLGFNLLELFAQVSSIVHLINMPCSGWLEAGGRQVIRASSTARRMIRIDNSIP